MVVSQFKATAKVQLGLRRKTILPSPVLKPVNVLGIGNLKRTPVL
jgi:hypothetical protein